MANEKKNVVGATPTSENTNEALDKETKRKVTDFEANLRAADQKRGRAQQAQGSAMSRPVEGQMYTFDGVTGNDSMSENDAPNFARTYFLASDGSHIAAKYVLAAGAGSISGIKGATLMERGKSFIATCPRTVRCERVSSRKVKNDQGEEYDSYRVEWGEE